MAIASKQIERIKQAFALAGFGESSLKTTNFDIRAVYDSFYDKNDKYISVFDGYECTHNLKLVFDFDTARLSDALGAVAKSQVNPKIKINFTIKDPTAINEMVLQDAAVNARKKAELLCAASSVRLGDLICIDYNWYASKTKYYMLDCIMELPREIEIDPDDVEAGDSAAFVWEILSL